MTLDGLSPRRTLLAPLAVAVGVLAATPAAAQVRANVIVRGGDTPAGAPGAVTEVFNPYLNGLDQIGFTGVAGGVQMVWVDSGITWLDTDDATDTLTLGDTDGMGFSDSGAFVYSPLVNGDPSIYSDQGALFVLGDAAPGVSNGVIQSLFMPNMLPNGDIMFVAGYDTDANSTVDGRAFYHLPAGNPANASIIYQTGDVISALTLSGLGPDSDQWVASNNGANVIGLTYFATGQNTDDSGLIVNGAVVVQELGSTGQGDNWDQFRSVAINNAGDYIFGGTTDGAGAVNAFVAYNGSIALREGDTLGDILFDGAVDAVDISNNGHSAFIWNNGQVESLYFSCDSSALPTTTRLLVAVGDEIDADGDDTSDFTITDFNAEVFNGPGLAFADDGFVYAAVDLSDGTSNEQAMVQLSAACCGDGLVGGFEDCDDQGESATCNDDCSQADCGDLIVNVSAGEDCDLGGGEAMFCDDDCTYPECGDGLLNVTAGETCDDGGESADCDDDCTPAACGDGKLNVAAGEACEDGNTDDGDGCSSSCQFEGQGQGGSGQGGSGQGGMADGGDAADGDMGPVQIDSGCGCRVSGDDGQQPWRAPLWLLLGGVFVLRRRRLV